MHINLLFICLVFNLNSIGFSVVFNSSVINVIENLFCQPYITRCNINYSYNYDDDRFAYQYLLPVRPPTTRAISCCDRCSCDLDTCEADESCCPDIAEYWTFEKPIYKIYKEMCVYPQLRPYSDLYPNSDDKFTIYVKCSNSFDRENDAFHKCENSGSIYDLDIIIPVSDRQGHYYKNKYCALCNNVNEDYITEWTSNTLCFKGETKIPNDLSEIPDTTGCNVIFNPDTNRMGHTCGEIISQCNVTGHWKKFDLFIEAACLKYRRIYAGTYRNVFCYLCNTDDFKGNTECKDAVYLVTITSILRKRGYWPTEQLCPPNFIYSPIEKICYEIKCKYHKRLLNGDCIRHVGYIGGITYQLYLRIIPNKDVRSYIGYPTGLNESITAWLRKEIKDVGRISLAFYQMVINSTSTVADGSNSTVVSFFVRVRLSIDAFPMFRTNIIDYMLSINGKSMKATVLGKVEKFKVEEAAYKEDSDPPIYIPRHRELIFISSDTYTERFPIKHINFLYKCPFVELKTEYGYLIRENYSVYLHDYKAEIVANEVYITRNHGVSSLFMCIRTFKRIISPFIEPILCDNKVSLHGILSLICFSISLAFSMVTLFFYLRLKRLKQTQPGVNNIVLCIALIVAQVLFQIGDPCILSKEACKIMGIFIHFSWLFLFFWMNICCIHMVRVFRFQTRQSFYNIPKTSFVYFLYSCFCSIMLVIANISIALHRSKGHDIGYGGTSCYINDPAMIAYLFALPVAIVLILNILLFIIVMVLLKNAPKIQRDKDDRNLIYIYARLSTLTGGTWLFGFTSFFFDIDILDYIFIILNAPQGLFLFFAFVANKRTLTFAFKKDIEDGIMSSTNSTYNHTKS